VVAGRYTYVDIYKNTTSMTAFVGDKNMYTNNPKWSHKEM